MSQAICQLLYSIFGPASRIAPKIVKSVMPDPKNFPSKEYVLYLRRKRPDEEVPILIRGDYS